MSAQSTDMQLLAHIMRYSNFTLLQDSQQNFEISEHMAGLFLSETCRPCIAHGHVALCMLSAVLNHTLCAAQVYISLNLPAMVPHMGPVNLMDQYSAYPSKMLAYRLTDSTGCTRIHVQGQWDLT